MTISLVDADLVAYRCAASAEYEPEEIAIFRARDLMTRLLYETSSEDYMAFLTGANNFRKKINPEYKANRKDTPKPKWLESCREYLVTEWNAKVTDGNEADDELGIWLNKSPENSIIVSLDKDLLQIPGRHYSWEINGTNGGKQWTRPAESRIISPREGQFNFYWQLVMGDRSDNVEGFDGKMRASVPKFMEPWYNEMQMAETEQELFSYVLDLYVNDLGRMLKSGRCLWIQREEGDDWLNHAKPIIQEIGQKDALTALSLQHLGQEQDAGPVSTNA